MIAGTLEVQMLANLARLSDDMAKAKNMVGGAMSSIEKSVSTAKAALGALGIGLGVGYFVSLIKGSIDAMDRLNDLSKSTGIAAEQLSGLQLAAKQSGGDLNSIADSINKLSQNMGKDAAKFRELGITAKDPLEAFKQLSDIFTKLHDPQQRAAVMAAALGKSWAGAAPLLAEGSAKIQEMVDKGSRLSGVTQEMVRQADELNDKWAELTGTGGLLTRMVGPLLPILTVLADELLRSSDNTNKLVGSMNPLTEVLKVILVLGSDVSFVFTTLGKEIAIAIERMRMMARGDFAGASALGETMRKDAEAARKELDAFQKSVMSGGASAKPSWEQEFAAYQRGMGGGGNTAAKAAKFLDDGKGAKDAEKRAQEVRDALHKVRTSEDERELGQIKFQNEQKAALEAEAAASYWAGRAATEERLIEEGQRTLANQRALQDELTAIDARGVQSRRDWEIASNVQRAQSIFGYMANVTAGVAQHNKKLFEINKVAGIANAVVNAYVGISKTLATYPYPWNLALAALHAVAAFAQVNAIKSQQFGGGGGVAPSLAGSTSAPPVSPVGSGAANDSGGGQTTIYNLHGEMFSRKQVRELLEMQNENAVDGSRSIVVEH